MRRWISILIVVMVYAATAGCARPTAPYDKGRALLIEGREQLVEGDRALARAQFDDAGDLYHDAARDLDRAVDHLETAERKVDLRVHALHREQMADEVRQGSASADTQDTSGNRFYNESLRGYREALALAVVMRAVALEREAEAIYRGAAYDVLAGDQLYPGQQFAAALEHYESADRGFRQAEAAFVETADFLGRRSLEADRLAEAAPPGTWPLMKTLWQLVGHRRGQTSAYRAATMKRSMQAGRVVQAYRKVDPGNIPNVTMTPLEALPETVRTGVVPPPIPEVRLGK
jgi:hypothetical protein